MIAVFTWPTSNGGLLLARVPCVDERKRVLVVDDDGPIRTMLAKIIGRQDLEVDTARDGIEAIERIDDNGYSAIVLDMMMPHVDGFGVLQHLVDHHPDELSRTIIASAIPESEILKRFKLPIYRIHTKPFDMGRLIDDIHACTAVVNRRSAVGGRQ